MGCCGSKDSTSEPNESTNLLGAGQVGTDVPSDHPVMDSHDYAAQILAQEAATLNQIVQKTAENLIDISRIHSVERVKLHESNIRSDEYHSRLGSAAQRAYDAQPRLSQIFNVPSSPSTPSDLDAETESDLPSILALLSTSPGTQQQLDKFNSYSKELARKIDQINVTTSGDFVVPLTFTSPAPVHP